MSNQPADNGRPQPEAVAPALTATGAPDAPPPPVSGRHKLAITAHVVLVVLLGAFYYVLHYEVIKLPFTALIQRFTVGFMLVILVVGASRVIQTFMIRRIGNSATEYNLIRVLRLVTGLVLALIVISLLFDNWYTAVVSLGLISLILGFALQTPITSFIGWIYILVRIPYRIGDRILINDAAGDVIEIGYLDTTLWEYGNLPVTNDRPSGRIIKFPNSIVLSSPTFNYSWPLFPFVWNEIALNIAYQSDLEFVAKVLTDIARDEFGEAAAAQVEQLRRVLTKTHVNLREIHAEPKVTFRPSENSWIEASVRYLVEPKDAAEVRSRLLERILTALNESPDRAMLPQGDAR